jgi:hypothetical protein
MLSSFVLIENMDPMGIHRRSDYSTAMTLSDTTFKECDYAILDDEVLGTCRCNVTFLKGSILRSIQEVLICAARIF